MARSYYSDPWKKKSQKGMRTLGKMIDFGIKVGKAAAKSSSTTRRSTRSYSTSGRSYYSGSSYSTMGVREQRRLEKERERREGEARSLELQEQSDAVVNTMRLVEPLIDIEAARMELTNLTPPKPYIRSPFKEEAPTEDDIRSSLAKEAEREVSSLLFWTNKDKRAAYVEEHLNERLSLAMDAWNERLRAWEAEQDHNERTVNEERQQAYEYQFHMLQDFLSDDPEVVCELAEDLVGTFDLPYDVSASMSFDEEYGVLALDIELPDKNVIPSEKGRVLASGKLSIKSKTIKEMNSDYLTSMLGVAYALASGLFNASAAIKNVDVMAHAQRMDGSMLQSRDTYLYAVSFERENFRNEVKSNLSPVDILILFPHLIKLTANNEMKPVDPERGILQ